MSSPPPERDAQAVPLTALPLSHSPHTVEGRGGEVGVPYL